MAMRSPSIGSSITRSSLIEPPGFATLLLSRCYSAMKRRTPRYTSYPPSKGHNQVVVGLLGYREATRTEEIEKDRSVSVCLIII